jgi:hypothetical protein
LTPTIGHEQRLDMRSRWLIGVLFLTVLFLGLGTAIRAEDRSLTDLRVALRPMLIEPEANPATRGATPQFEVVKTLLRDWVEARLLFHPRDGDDALLGARLNQELRDADLACLTSEEVVENRCGAGETFNSLGFLGAVEFRRQQGGQFLVLQTAVGIACGFDESAYVYEWQRDRWRRVWRSEQVVYTKEQYTPQTIHAVLVSKPDRHRRDHLILSLGSRPDCGGGLQPVYYRLWRLNEDRFDVKLLMNRSEIAVIGTEPPITGSVVPGGAVVEFAAPSLDVKAGSRRVVRSFVVDGEDIRRVDPVALGPRGFIEDWLAQRWVDSIAWVRPGARPALERWHNRLHDGGAPKGSFAGVTQQCSVNRWQVGVSVQDQTKGPRDIYFLVRWRPPYYFEMLDIRDKRWAECAESDERADEARTLFASQEGR